MTGTDLEIAALVLGAAVIQGIIGFAFGMVLMSLLPRLLPLGTAVATTATLGVFVAALVFWRYRRHVLWGEVGPQLLGAAVGLPIGVYALQNLPPDPCIRVLGGLLLAYVLLEARPRRAVAAEGPVVPRAWGVPAGLLAGAFGGAFSTGGPPVIAYGNARRFEPRAFKAVLQAFFVTVSTAHLLLLASAGILTARVGTSALLFLPLVVLGTWLGGRCGDLLRPALFRRLVLAALFVLGADYLVLGR